MTDRFTARGWLLFAAMCVLWGMPYLFIKEAVETIPPATVAAVRALGAAAILLPFAIRRGALRPALRHWPWVLAFGALEMAGPFLLLGLAEQTLPSGLTGLLVATVPLFAALIAVSRGDRAVLQPLRLLGLLIGFAGVVVIVAGPGLTTGADLVAIGQVLLVAFCYALAPFIVAARLPGVPSIGVVTLSLAAVGFAYLPVALAIPHPVPSATSILSVAVLTVFCSAIALMLFFALIREVGPTRAPLFTYVNPVVAIGLGVIVLGESLGVGLLAGFPLVIVGCWLAATGGRWRPAREPGEPPTPVAPA